MSRPSRPEPGVEYCAWPSPEFAEARSLSASASLAKFLGVTEDRARELLADPAAYRAEIRRRTPEATRLRKAWRQGYPDPYPS